MLNIKAGDQVFVVHQLTRYQKTHKTETLTVTKVGRDYGYIGDMKFSLSTGQSHHKEGYVRSNGEGFDVYQSEQDYLAKQLADSEFKRLKERLIANYCGLKDLPADVVSRIHAVLDEHKGDL